MRVRGSCGHIIEGVTLFDSSSDDEEHQSSLPCPDCLLEKKGGRS